jgi:sigma-E factor negative regulatory protein RseB
MAVASCFHRSLILTASLALAGVCLADDRADVERWLDRMAHAVESLDYRGTLVYWQGERFDTLKIIHRADDSGVRERLYSLSGQPREVLRDGNQVRTLLAGQGEVIVQSQLTARLLPNLPLRRLNLAAQAYAMHVRDQERIAGHQARVIEILPQDEFRYGYRFWLEQTTGMLLRSALLDQAGEAIQQMTFVEIELGARINDYELEPQIEPEAVVESRLAPSAPTFENLTAFDAAAAGGSQWLPPTVPAHFQLARQGQGETQNGAEFRHLLYSDGLASFSVYIEEDDADHGSGRIESLGTVHVLSGRFDDRQVTIVGEVPMATVRLVGQWLQRDAEARNNR